MTPLGMLLNLRRARMIPFAGGLVVASSVDLATRRMASATPDVDQPYSGHLLISSTGMHLAYQAWVLPEDYTIDSTAWFEERFPAADDGVAQILVARGALTITSAVEFRFPRFPFVVLGRYGADVTLDGSLRAVGANWFPEGGEGSNSTLDPQDTEYLANRTRDIRWANAEWDRVGGGGTVSFPGVPALGGAGGAGRSANSAGNGNPGSDGSEGGCGGGGGGSSNTQSGASSPSGAGAAGYVFGGGSAGGGQGAVSDPLAQDGEPFGGAGGDAGANSTYQGFGVGGGAGNPGGHTYFGSNEIAEPDDNTGGILLVLAGTLTGTGSASADGFEGSHRGSDSGNSPVGGGTGGGSVTLLCKTYTGTITVTATGGQGGDSSLPGGNGGNGTERILEG